MDTTIQEPKLGSGASPVAAATSRVLATSYTDLELRKALKILSTRISANDADTRRNLRANAEQEILDINGKALREFEIVAERIRILGQSIDLINAKLGEIDGEIELAVAVSKPVVEITQRLTSKESELTTQIKVLDAYFRAFTLSDTDISILKATERGLHPDFFATLSKAQEMYNRTESLLTGDDVDAGMNIAQNLSSVIEDSYRRLEDITVVNVLNLFSDSHITADRRLTIRKMLTVLAQRSILLKAALGRVIENRRADISRQFFKAITSSENGNTPIEINAMDPVRYVGDMLAWIYSAAISEAEVIRLIFSEEVTQALRESSAGDYWFNQVFEVDLLKSVQDLADQSLVGALNELRTRVTHVIASCTSATELYEVYSTIGFYIFAITKTFTRTGDSAATIVQALQSLMKETSDKFFATLDSEFNVAKSELSRAPVGKDLLPPDILVQAIDRAAKVMKNYESAPFTKTNSERVEEFKPIYEKLVSPYLDLALNLPLSDNTPGAREVYQANCIECARNTLLQYLFVQDYVTDMDAQLADLQNELIAIQTNLYLDASGLRDLNVAKGDVSDKIQRFLSEIPNAVVDKLSSPRIKQAVVRQATDNFVTEYAEAQSAMQEAESLPFTVDEIRTLML
ncbi:hypothetical protein CANCADRAFT_4440 [Tortispora caseinolytica NRRL Y-17796]|uniref:Conserved oligomeric Golgi complex subunit 6 n=1 Tax=Tortispora caseinolytica NRRL Y-17796 TaxID=767744 RepID=A0A1E4TDN1_9ASCO|nr:hypothetical protein CANCADRAFT_4440 [Tortispora caseinolytica NRRL Y-17796]